MKKLRADLTENRDRILAASETLFATDGPMVSFEKIAAAAGIGRATMFRHFRDRAALQIAVLHRGVVRIEAQIAQIDSVGGLLDLFAANASTFVAFADCGGIHATNSEEIRAARSKIDTLTANVIDVAKKGGNLRPDFSTDDLILFATMCLMGGFLPRIADGALRARELFETGLLADL